MKVGTGIEQVRIADIEVGTRVRPLDAAFVEALKISIGDLGEITTPLHLRKVKGGFRLMDGLHRYTAAKGLGLDTVPALVWDCTAAEAALFEVDANVTTAHLHPVDVAVNLAGRKSAYEKLHPETRQGTAGALAKHGLQTTNLSFGEYMAKVLGLSRRQVERMIASGESLTHDEVRWIRSAPRRANYSDLEAISKTPPGHDRSQAIIRFSNGEAKTVRAALKAIRPDAAPPKDPAEEAFKALCKAFDRAPMAARRRFAEAYAPQLDAILFGGDDE